MALLYNSTLNPPKLRLLTPWLARQSWFPGGADVGRLASYRFDDPVGEVGIETFLLQADDGPVLQAPVTYRGAPLVGADPFLLGIATHSVLGTRWVYDGCGDPAWASALALAALTGGAQAEELIEIDGRLQSRDPTATVLGSGTPGAAVGDIDAVSCHDAGPTTVIHGGGLEIVVARVVGAELPAGQTLTGWWAGGGPALLASVRPIPAT